MANETDSAQATGQSPSTTSRRKFVKGALVGGVTAAVAGGAFLSQSLLRPSSAPQSGYGSHLVWRDPEAGLFRRRNLVTGVDEFSNVDAGAVIQDTINALPSPVGSEDPTEQPAVGGEIWLSNDVDARNAVVTINKHNVSLIALRSPPPKMWDHPRPHIQKIVYTGPVRGGLLQGLHCREIQFDGTGNQQLMALRDIAMHVSGGPNGQGLRFLGGAGYIQFIEIQNLKIALSSRGVDDSAIEFGNSNGGSGHLTFSGNTTLETEYDAAGSPVAIKISTGAETGTPIRFENLSIVELGSRTEGEPLRPILMQSQSEISKGLRQMHIERLFFEQHYTSPHTIVTIDPATGSGACWFGLTIDELVISDEADKVVNLIDNKNGSWMSREQNLRVNAGVKTGVGVFALGNPNPHEHFRVYVGNVSGVTPFGKVATPFYERSPVSFVGPGGASVIPGAAGDYVVAVSPIVVTSTGAWSMKDNAGNLIETVPAGEARSVPLGYRVQFPSGTPTVYA